MNSLDIFTIGLGLVEPWIVTNVEFKGSKTSNVNELHITIDFKRGYGFSLEDGTVSSAYDTVDRTWQHLNFFQHRCYLHARVPRVKDKSGKPQTIAVPWARANSGFTLLFEAYSMLLIESEMSVSKVSECLNVTAPRVWRVFNYWIEKAINKDDLSTVKSVGVDETSRKKGHNYITNFVDLDTRRTVFVTEGKDSKTLDLFASELEVKGGSAENIELISMDMSAAFFAGYMNNFPKAKVVFDKFHIIKDLNKALDEVRKRERKSSELLKGHKYTFLRRSDKLSANKKGELEYLLTMYPTLGEAYRFREMFLEVYSIAEPDEAKGYIQFWCDMVMESNIAPLKKFVNTIKSHWMGIAQYFDNRISNGILEGINSKIQLAKRRARGYRNVKNYINMVYFLSAKLKYDYPLYPL